jgi:hypothetical protein
VPQFSTKYIYNIVDNNWVGGGYIHPMTMFFKLLNIVDENKFLNKISKIILVPSSYFPPLSQFHYPSLLDDIQVCNINTWTKNEDVYK